MLPLSSKGYSSESLASEEIRFHSNGREEKYGADNRLQIAMGF